MLIIAGANKDPSPNAYNRAQSMEYILQQSPAFSIQIRRERRHGGRSRRVGCEHQNIANQMFSQLAQLRTKVNSLAPSENHDQGDV